MEKYSDPQKNFRPIEPDQSQERVKGTEKASLIYTLFQR